MEATTSREDVAEASVGVSVGRSASTHGARGREATTPSRSVTMDDDDDEEGDDDGGDARRGAWLMKRSDKTKTWNRRWVRVVNGRLEFRTRADEGGTPSSSCALGDVAGCVVSSLNIHGERERAGCGIYIDIKGSREGVFLCAETPREAKRWVEAFRDARASARRDGAKTRVDARNDAVDARSRGERRRENDIGALVVSPRSGADATSPGGSLDTRGRVLDTFGAMELALQAKDELLAAEAAGKSSLESALRSEGKLNAELQKKVLALRERLDSREKELRLVRENLDVEKEYARELKEQLDDALMHATEMEDTASAATIEIERLDRELADAKSTRERMEEALMSEGDYLRRREAEEFQRQRHLETQLDEAKRRIDELELKHEGEIAEVRRRTAHKVAVASATEQELLLSRDRLLSELARMRREGYETVLHTNRETGQVSATPTPTRARTASIPTTPSRLGQVSPSPRRVTFQDAVRVHRVRDSPSAPRSYASHPEPESTPDRTRRALFQRASHSPGKNLEASAVIDRLDSPGTHGCRVQ